MVRGAGDGARQRVIASPGGVRIRMGNPNALLPKAPETSPAHHVWQAFMIVHTEI